MNGSLRKLFRLCSTLAFVLQLVGCEPALRAKVDGGIIPIFRFYGDDVLLTFFITPNVANAPGCRSNGCALWQIDPIAAAETPSEITYGVVPPGFKQVIPISGSPPPLEPNKKYAYHFVRNFGGGGSGLIILDGKAREW